MKSSPSESPPAERPGPFCHEPWSGVFTILENGDAVMCACYLKMKIGNVHESSMHEIWNAPELIEIREAFQRGELPKPCESQICPPVLAHKG